MTGVQTCALPISALAAIAAGLVLSRITGTTVRDGLRPLTQLRPSLHRPGALAPEADSEAAA